MVENEDYIAVYNCDGSTVRWDFTFAITDESDLDVRHYDDTVEGELTLILGTDYTVERATIGTWLDGGTVVAVTAYPSNDRISLTRDVSLTQLLDYVENNPFPAESHEGGLDKLTFLQQQIQEFLDRVMTIPKSDPTGLTLELPSKEARLGKFIQFNQITGAPEVVSVLASGEVTITAWGEAWLLLNSDSDAMDDLGFSAFFKTLIAAASGDAFNALTGAFDKSVDDLTDITGDLDDISDGTNFFKIPIAGYIQLSLTNYDADTVPQIAAGSKVFVGLVANISYSSNTTITGSPSNNVFNYIYVQVGGTPIWRTNAPTWNAAEQQWKLSSERCVGGCYYDGSNYLMKWVYTNQHAGPKSRKLGIAYAGYVNNVTFVHPQGDRCWFSDTGTLYIPLQLPDRALVTALYSYATYSAAPIYQSLVSSTHVLGTGTIMAQNTHSSTGGQTDTSITGPVIDNDERAYHAEILGDTSAGGEARGFEISYTEVVRC